MADKLTRCDWRTSDQILLQYHDTEWGVPVHDDQKLFEFFALDCFQAGLSWLTVLKKRDNFRKAFDDFKIPSVASFDNKKVTQLLKDPGIIRNRQKIEAAINNAQRILDLLKDFKSFDRYIWQFTNYKTITNRWKNISELPVTSKESDEMSKDLKSRGFKFAGTTLCYAFMQSVGMVNDHTVDCFRHSQV